MASRLPILLAVLFGLVGCSEFAARGDLQTAFELYMECDFEGAAAAAQDAIEGAPFNPEIAGAAYLLLGASHDRLGISSEASTAYRNLDETPETARLKASLNETGVKCAS